MSIFCKILRKLCKEKPIQYKKPENIIKAEQAVKMYHNYNRRVELINKAYQIDGNGEDFRSTRSLFYDLDDLYNYLGYIKQQSKKAKINPSGVRIYFAEYDEDYIRDKKSDYAKRQTIFITPTVEHQGEHLGYTLDKNFKIRYLFDLLSKQFSKENIFMKEASYSRNPDILDPNSLIANEFTGSPPKGNNP